MSIQINKNTSRFFIAINKINHHSFLMLGTYDKNKVAHLLCRVGKSLQKEEDTNACVYYKIFSSHVKSELIDEGVSRKKRNKAAISYQAYDITYDQYLQFIQMLESIQTDTNRFSCYKPSGQNGNNVTLELTSLKLIPKTNTRDLNSEVNEFNINKTCRHTAINLVEQVQGVPVASLVSKKFFMDLPYKTALEYGKPCKEIPFYVLPVSPAAFPDLTAEKKCIVEKLYRQMEHMLLLAPNSEQTQNKFNCLKDLYTEILGPQKQLSLNELLESIQNWKQINESTLKVLRKTYFWDSFFTRESATMKLITEIEQDLQPSI